MGKQKQTKQATTKTVAKENSPSPKPVKANPPTTTIEKVDKKPKVKEPERDKIALHTHPILTLKIFCIIMWGHLKSLAAFIARYKIAFSVLVAAIVLPHLINGPHSPLVGTLDEIALFAGWWILLGVASSIGLGTGLHTFVLYLGPHIAKVTMVAYQCRSIPEYLPSRWNFHHFDECPDPLPKEQISFWTILLSVQAEAFLWGFGTALGELPPYFMARAASLSGKKSEELLELEEEMRQGGKIPIMERIKLIIYRGLKTWGFVTVLACASIPNPLFDLAGITCGHFLFPFASFFLATMIGKAIIKVHIQMLFVIFVFSKHHVEHFLRFIEARLPFLRQRLSAMLEKQKVLLHTKEVNVEEKPLIAQVWEIFIIGMIVYFLVSIINSSVNQYLDEQEEEKQTNGVQGKDMKSNGQKKKDKKFKKLD